MPLQKEQSGFYFIPNWNVGAGLFRPDEKLRLRVDAAIKALLADGTIAQIYARYDIELRPPR
ncbi:MAG: hypothetical protein ABIL01_24215 [Pseudomonadota bacterium]